MRRITPFIPSSFETCAPPLEGTYVHAPTNHVAVAVRTLYVPPMGGAHVGAPVPWSLLGRRRPRPCAPHSRSHPTAHAPHGPTPVRAPTFAPPVRAPEAFVPLLRAPRDVHAHAPLEYKFIKIVVHSTTWASRPSTTMRWMIAGCLGGDHSFLIHSHGPRAHPRTRLYACLI
jgi:hypothetical protein